MAITRVDTATGNAGAGDNGNFGSPSLTTTRDLNVGEKVFIYYTGKHAFGAITALTGFGSNSPALAKSQDDGSANRCELWYCDITTKITSGTTLGATVTSAGGGWANLVVVSYTGLASGGPDKTAGANNSFTSSQASGTTAATTTASELVIGVFEEQSASITLSSVATGYTVGTAKGTANGMSVNEYYKTVSSTGTQSATGTTSSADTGVAVITTWAAAGGSTDTFTFATSDSDAPAFTLAGMTDSFAVATTDHDAPAFVLAGMLDSFTLPTSDVDTVAFTLGGMTDTFTVAATDMDTVSFGVQSLPPAGSLPPQKTLVGFGL